MGGLLVTLQYSALCIALRYLCHCCRYSDNCNRDSIAIFRIAIDTAQYCRYYDTMCCIAVITVKYINTLWLLHRSEMYFSSYITVYCTVVATLQCSVVTTLQCSVVTTLQC